MIDLDHLQAQALSEELQRDPYPLYDQIRETGRVLWSAQLGRWLVTGLEEVQGVLRDDRFSADRTRWDRFASIADQIDPPRSMLVVDPPDHSRLRTLVQKAFTPRVVERLRPRVQELVDRALDRAQETGNMELVEDLAYPLPVTVIAELLGVPIEDQAQFRGWSAAMVGAADPLSPQARIAPESVEARRRLRQYLAGIIEERRQAPRDDMISRLVEAEEQGDRLDGEELLQMSVLLLVAGHETTVNLIANGVNALLDNRAQLDRLRARPELIESAVEELLRYDSPVQMTGRVPVEDFDFAGQRLEAGQMVMLVLGAANRDPRFFAAPGQLDLGRSPNHHVAFGRGVHFCLGAPLARLEGQVAIGSLVARFSKLHRAGPARRRPTINLRGFASLPLSVS